MEAPRQSLRARVTGLFGLATLAGCIIGIAYWSLEAALHAWVFHTGSFTTELVDGDGNELWMRSFTLLLFVLLGVIVQWHLNGVRALAARLRRLAAAVEQAGDGVLISDARGLIEYVNPAFTRLTGYELSELRGKTPAVLKSGATNDGLYRLIWATIKGGKAWSGRIVDRRKDGTYYPTALTIAPITGPKGEIINYVGVQHDMSAQVELEERLRQSEKLQTLGTLASGIAHDFNNVLALVILQLELVSARAGANPELTPLLADLERTLGGAKAMVRQLVSFSRRGSATTAFEPFEVKPWLDRAWPSLRLLVPDPLELRLESPLDAEWVRGDEQALQQVLTNLVQNARDVLLPRGHGVITVNWEVVADGARVVASAAKLAGTRCVWIRVSDDGPGVPAELQERIFEPFFSTKGERGTGMGLAMVRETVRRHGGTLWVTSEPERGATFHLLLPTAAPGVTTGASAAELELH
jgi:PAS domain S-box-containing protein